MADETNLRSKLPVADRTREVSGRKRCWWCLSSSFPLCTFLLGFADSFCFVFTSFPFYEASPLCTIMCNFVRSCAICSDYSVVMLKSLREALRVSLYGFFCPPWERFPTWSSPWRIFFGKRSSGILVTWPVHLNCVTFRREFPGLLCLQSCLATWSLEVF